MSKAETLIAAAPHLWAIDVFGGMLYSFLDDHVLGAEYEEDLDVLFIRERLIERHWHSPSKDVPPTLKPSLGDRIMKALTSEPLGSIDAGGLEEMRQALDVMLETNHPREMFDAAWRYYEGMQEFFQYFEAQAKDAFGTWGHLLFRYIMEDLPIENIEQLSRSFEIHPDPNSLAAADPVELDMKLFAVRSGDREPCRLGNSRQFRLLEALLQRQGRFVSFSDLAEAMGGDSVDAGLMPAVKCRLVRLLTEGGYEDLAARIKVHPDHYGWF